MIKFDDFQFSVRAVRLFMCPPARQGDRTRSRSPNVTSGVARLNGNTIGLDNYSKRVHNGDGHAKNLS